MRFLFPTLLRDSLLQTGFPVYPFCFAFLFSKSNACPAHPIGFELFFNFKSGVPRLLKIPFRGYRMAVRYQFPPGYILFFFFAAF